MNKNSTREAAARKASGGMLPHEWLCAVMDGDMEFSDYVVGRSGSVIADEDGKPLVIQRKPTFAERLDAAGKAAPFFAPKLAAKAVVEDPKKNPIDALMDAVAASAHNRARPQ